MPISVLKDGACTISVVNDVEAFDTELLSSAWVCYFQG